MPVAVRDARAAAIVAALDNAMLAALGPQGAALVTSVLQGNACLPLGASALRGGGPITARQASIAATLLAIATFVAVANLTDTRYTDALMALYELWANHIAERVGDVGKLVTLHKLYKDYFSPLARRAIEDKASCSSGAKPPLTPEEQAAVTESVVKAAIAKERRKLEKTVRATARKTVRRELMFGSPLGSPLASPRKARGHGFHPHPKTAPRTIAAAARSTHASVTPQGTMAAAYSPRTPASLRSPHRRSRGTR